MTLAVGAIFLSLIADDAALDEWADQLVAVATEQGFPVWGAVGTIHRGWVKVKNGDVTEGMSLVRSGSAAYRATETEMWTPHFFALLARACEIAGQNEEGLTALDDALQLRRRDDSVHRRDDLADDRGSGGDAEGREERGDERGDASAHE